jgi:hypothetical protein
MVLLNQAFLPLIRNYSYLRAIKNLALKSLAPGAGEEAEDNQLQMRC